MPYEPSPRVVMEPPIPLLQSVAPHTYTMPPLLPGDVPDCAPPKLMAIEADPLSPATAPELVTEEKPLPPPPPIDCAKIAEELMS